MQQAQSFTTDLTADGSRTYPISGIPGWMITTAQHNILGARISKYVHVQRSEGRSGRAHVPVSSATIKIPSEKLYTTDYIYLHFGAIWAGHAHLPV